MNKNSGTGFFLAKLTKDARFSARLVILYVIADFLLTPLGGLETRPVSQVTTTGLATLGLLFTGLALNVVYLILILRHYNRAPIFGILGSILFFPAAIADQTGQFSSLSPPAGITSVEAVEALVAISIIFFGVRLLQKRQITES
jgi:hypothetical protein